MRSERPDHTLGPTSLVNEAYVRLIDVNRMHWQNRAHFLAIAATTMRRILVESARRRRRQKRGGDVDLIAIDDAPEVGKATRADIVAVDDALTALAAVDRRMSQVVEMRFFGGLTVDETANALKVSPETVMREWKAAKVWLLRELSR
jgi:RNA polymerase sigma factor (TIGR02999 family)